MKKNLIKKEIAFFLFAIFLINFSSAAYTSSNPQLTQYPQQNSAAANTLCNSGTDFLVQIAPLGCEPLVVRSDLLEEQNVPVYCKLAATKINPLIDVKVINNIAFTGDFSKQVSGVSFHPAGAALGTNTQMNSPLLNNIGYAVITLKQQKNESSMPDFVYGNLTANLKYDIKTSLGIGTADFYLPELNDEDWQAKYNQYEFWNGKGYLRADSIGTDAAKISFYDKNLRVISSVNLKKGETSGKIAFPGFDCLGGLSLKLDSLDNPGKRARLRINADVAEVASGESFLDNKCSVTSLDTKGIIQKAQISCKEDSNGFYQGKSFSLQIIPNIDFKIDNQDKNAGLGDYLYDAGDKSYYLAYIGTNKDSKKQEDLFVYLLSLPITNKKDKLSDDELASVSNAANKLTYSQNGKTILGTGDEVINKLLGFGISIGKFLQGEQMYNINHNQEATIGRKKILLVNYASPENIDITDAKILSYYNNAVKDYNEISDSFVQEKYPADAQETLGEDASYNHLELLYDLGQKRSMADLCDKFKQDYPASEKDLSICNDAYKLSNTKTNTAYVLINGKSVQISFDGIYNPSIDEYSAWISVRGPNGEVKPYILTTDETQTLEGLRSPDASETVKLVSLDKDSATLRLNLISKKGGNSLSSSDKKLTKDSPVSLGEYTFTLTDIKLKKTARVSLIPSISAAGSQTNFQFKIGIEKRWNITLAPEQIKKTITVLNSTISQIENISDGLGKVVEAGKTACLATGGVLIVSNFLQAFEGKAIARQTIMKAAGGWYEKCAGKDLDKCLLDNSSRIDKDVDALTKLMNDQNTNMKQLELQNSVTGMLGEKNVNEEAFLKAYCSQVANKIRTGNFAPDNKDAINLEQIKKILSAGNADIQQCRDIELYNNILNSQSSGELSVIANKNLYSKYSDLQIAYGKTIAKTTKAGELRINPEQIGVYESKDTKKLTYQGLTYDDIKDIVPSIPVDGKTPIYLEQYQDKFYVVVLDDLGTKTLPIKRLRVQEISTLDVPTNTIFSTDKLMIYDMNGNLVSEPEKTIPGLKDIYFQKLDTSSYQNKYANPETRFYDTEPYKGMPAVVPFDINNGWYAATKPTLPILGNIKSFDESGKVTSYWLCNVGENKKEENTGGDDICEQINLGTGQAYNVFPGLDATEAQKRITAGAKAITLASQQYNSGSNKININAGFGNAVSALGRAAANLPAIQCQDFMSPSECQVLFNVCDPFICPSSRCDFGGAYPVKDVIQSGIIGSIALCLPNFKEGILVPVCITGIKAGLDGFLSVEKSYRDCLQNSLDTGQVMGICDEIHSLYLCDFFWKQAIPLAKVAVPNLISAVLGGFHGGGEYLGIASAFDNAEKSLNYFVQYYGSSAGKAFNVRSAEEFIGDAICKTYSSAVYPNGADLLATLTKPSSPPQYTGRFDEIPFTTATVPPTSQYKVFYHIFAGNDAGAYYQVYLKANTQTFYQDTSSTYVVASGYAPIGGYASDTKDFTAPSGYKQLCINVNGDEECDFQEVSTSFAVNYIQESYVSQQASQTNIKTAGECSSGSVSPYLLNPNLAQGIQQSVNPQIYNQGIIRICASGGNPGEGTDPSVGTKSQRWIEVGYCDDIKIKCWLDTQSVKDAIDIGTIKNDTLSAVNKNYQDILSKSGAILSDADYSSLIEQLKKEKDPANRVTIVDDKPKKANQDNQKAYLFLWRGDAYAELARKLFPDFLKNLIPKSSATKTTTVVKTYVIDKIGFSIQKLGTQSFGGIAGTEPFTPVVNFETDVTKKNDEIVTLTIVPDNNCEKEEYQIFSDQKVFLGKIRKGISNLFGGNFNPNEPMSGRIDLQTANALLNGFSSGSYFADVYCFDLNGKSKLTSSKNKVTITAVTSGTTTARSGTANAGSETPSGSGIGLIDRYETNLKPLFRKYSTSYAPSGWNPLAFESLLLAIATRQSNLGFPEGKYDPRWIMEYGWKDGTRMPGYKCEFSNPTDDQKYSCADIQIKDAAATLKMALDKKDITTGDLDLIYKSTPTNNYLDPYYDECDGITTRDNGENPANNELLKCVVSAYMTGIKDTTSEQGKAAAEDVIQLMIAWREYLNSGDTQAVDESSLFLPSPVSSDNFWVFSEPSSDGVVVQ